MTSSEPVKPPPSPPWLPGADIHRMVGQLRLVAAVVWLALAAVAAAAALLLAVRALLRPVAGSFGPVVAAGVVSLAALAGAMTAMELTSRRAKKEQTLEAAAAQYKLGCLIAAGVNFAAACVTLLVLLTNGVSGGLWAPQALVLAVNVLGLVLAVPRVRHLRRLHYRPILPVTRV